MKKQLLSILLVAVTSVTVAQEVTKDDSAKLMAETDKLKAIKMDSAKNWKLGGIVSISGQQVGLTNWSAGGANSISIGGLINVFAKYKKDKSTWDNNLELGYGLINQGDSKVWQKNDDKIQFTSKYGRQAFNKWYYTALGDFRSQFTEGYVYPNTKDYISNFMAPAYALASIGLDYKPNDHFSLFISPLTGKFTFVYDDSLSKIGAFGVQKEIRDANNPLVITQAAKKHREEFGAYLKAQYQTKVMDNITFQTVVELFTNYLKNPQNVDVNWTTLTTFKVNKFISANFSTQLLYDDDINVLRTSGDKSGSIGPDIQFKQVLSVGFSYKF